MNALWRQFDALVKLPNCTCNASAEFTKHTQLIKLMQFLMGLDDVYLPIRSSILTTDPLPSVKTAFSIVSREESHRGVSNSNNTGLKTQTSAYFSRTPENKRKPGFRTSPLVCKHCGVNGHTVELTVTLLKDVLNSLVFQRIFKTKEDLPLTPALIITSSLYRKQ